MNLIKIDCKINDYLIECNGTEENNVIIFKDNEYNIMSFDYNRLVLSKDKEYIIDFQNKTCLFENGIKFSIEVDKIKCDNSNIIITYRIGEQVFNFSLKYTM